MPLIATLALAAEGCTRCAPQPPTPRSKGADDAISAALQQQGGNLLSAQPGTHELGIGEAPFRFDYESVSELLITKSDAESGDRWSARLERAGSGDGACQDACQGAWMIRSGPGGRDLLDARADARFVSHLLDTLRTLQMTAPAPEGPPASLGLDPPRFALKWKTREQDFELRVGSAAARPSSAPDPGGAYAWVPGAPGSLRVAVMDGAALRMLDYLSSFDILRSRTLATIAADDVEELEIRRGGKALLFAQREGDDWTDRRHRKHRGGVGAVLDGIAHARILAFCDDVSEATRVRTDLERAPAYEAVLRDRHGHPTSIRLKWDPRGRRELWAEVSSRPGGVFRVYPELTRFFENLPK